MALTKSYTVSPNKIPALMDKIRDGQAPEQLSQQLLKDWGFSSSNDRALIPLLKSLGFLSPDGKPTSRYHDYRDHSKSKKVLGTALKEAYGDLFLIKEKPTTADKAALKGKFKSYHNVKDNVAGLMVRNFYALLDLADLDGKDAKKTTVKTKAKEEPATEASEPTKEESVTEETPVRTLSGAGLHYNIQIHLLATKDVEVYNAIFKSLREHLVEE